jgi:hypothetical protein
MRELLTLLIVLVLPILTVIPVASQGVEISFSTEYSPSTCPPYLDYQINTAYDPCRFPNFFSYNQPGLIQPANRLQVEAPDLNAAFIMQMPRYDYDAPKNRHAPGDLISFIAHVANRGNQPTGSFIYMWYIDGSLVLAGTNASLDPSEMSELTLNWTWQTGSHNIRIELDPDDSISEVSEQNNILEDQTNALAVGLWVEQSVYDWFNENQVTLSLGSVSWDDWAQRQLRVWNQMLADAITPLTMQGVNERVRLDKVTVVPDGSLPSCATNFPAIGDKTIDLQWGFPSELVGIPSGHTCGGLNYYFNHPESQNIEYSLMHELSHARYLIDLYGLNVCVNETRLSGDVSSVESTLNVDRDIQNDENFPLPAYLSVDGELIICQSKIGSAFVNCSRGEEETMPRAHFTGDLVNNALVRIKNDQGNLVQGSSEMPLMGFDDHLYYNRYPDDLMSGGLRYEQHSAYALNRIAGQRPICGNYNSPCNIGEYLNDIPKNNIIEVRNLSGEPIAWARIEVYQASPFPIWYGKYFDNSPDIVRFTNTDGRADLGSFPFGSGESINHGFGYSNALVLIKITSGGESSYQFFEVTETNEAYWSGHQNSAIYVKTVDLPEGSKPFQLFLPTILVNFSPPQPSLELHFEGSFTGADGENGTASGVTFTSGHSGQGVLFDDNDTLGYAAYENIHREHGSIEFWLRPLWNGNDGESYVFFEIGDAWFNRMRIMKDGANNFRFMVWSEDTEYDVAYNVSGWNANEWHQVRVTWKENEIALYLDGTLRDIETGVALAAYFDSTLHLGSTSEGDTQAHAIMDEFMIYTQP